MSASDPLVGAWRLQRWVSIDEEGTETEPLGDRPDGLLTYTADGSMLAMMGRADRPPFVSGDPVGGSEAERAHAFATFLAFGGRYELSGATVTHHIETSLFPNWVGSAQRRAWELDQTGRRLTLTSPPLELAGAIRVQRLTWERVGD
jgi:hypothetical protein